MSYKANSSVVMPDVSFWLSVEKANHKMIEIKTKDELYRLEFQTVEQRDASFISLFVQSPLTSPGAPWPNNISRQSLNQKKNENNRGEKKEESGSWMSFSIFTSKKVEQEIEDHSKYSTENKNKKEISDQTDQSTMKQKQKKYNVQVMVGSPHWVSFAQKFVSDFHPYMQQHHSINLIFNASGASSSPEHKMLICVVPEGRLVGTFDPVIEENIIRLIDSNGRSDNNVAFIFLSNSSSELQTELPKSKRTFKTICIVRGDHKSQDQWAIAQWVGPVTSTNQY